MVVTVHSQQFTLTPELKRFALENLHQPLARIWDREGAQLDIMLRDLRGTKGGVDKECRCILYIPNGTKLVITEVTDDMRTSIHQARRRLMRRARQYVGHKLVGDRRPRKYFLARAVNDGMIESPARVARSQDARGGRETHG